MNMEAKTRRARRSIEEQWVGKSSRRKRMWNRHKDTLEGIVSAACEEAITYGAIEPYTYVMSTLEARGVVKATGTIAILWQLIFPLFWALIRAYVQKYLEFLISETSD